MNQYSQIHIRCCCCYCSWSGHVILHWAPDSLDQIDIITDTSEFGECRIRVTSFHNRSSFTSGFCMNYYVSTFVRVLFVQYNRPGTIPIYSPLPLFGFATGATAVRQTATKEPQLIFTVNLSLGDGLKSIIVSSTWRINKNIPHFPAQRCVAYRREQQPFCVNKWIKLTRVKINRLDFRGMTMMIQMK